MEDRTLQGVPVEVVDRAHVYAVEDMWNCFAWDNLNLRIDLD